MSHVPGSQLSDSPEFLENIVLPHAPVTHAPSRTAGTRLSHWFGCLTERLLIYAGLFICLVLWITIGVPSALLGLLLLAFIKALRWTAAIRVSTPNLRKQLSHYPRSSAMLPSPRDAVLHTVGQYQASLENPTDREYRDSCMSRQGVSTEGNEATVDLRPVGDRTVDANARPAVALPKGRVLRERYVIQEKLGTGGRGTVYKAHDRYRLALPEPQQYVALKVLHSGGDCADQTVKDIGRELHCGQALSHRNIVNVFELDRDGEIIFFTMELLDGELLSSLIQRMRPTAMHRSQAWQIIRQLGAAIEHAHGRGVVHGDLKPGNILVTHDGEVRILDFGAARTLDRRQSDPQRDLAPATGTPAYASCELLEGRAADPSDDVYALACIAYELLTGTHPFAGRPAILARNFDVKAARPAGLTQQQWRTLQRGFAWHRAGRPKSVHAWIQRLTHRVAEDASITPLRELKIASAEEPPSISRAVAAALAVVLITGISIAELRGSSLKTHGAAGATTGTAKVPPAAPALPLGEPPQDPRVLDTQAAGAPTEHRIAQTKPSAMPSPSMISVEGYQVNSGNHFVEIRVRRNELHKNSSFVWWTEPATARQDVDYVHQAKAIQTFLTGRRSTRFYVKLLPESDRSQRDYFYVAIARTGRDRTSDKVIRAQIWLPTPRNQLQARR